jgi:hypothetical protein
MTISCSGPPSNCSMPGRHSIRGPQFKRGSTRFASALQAFIVKENRDPVDEGIPPGNQHWRQNRHIGISGLRHRTCTATETPFPEGMPHSITVALPRRTSMTIALDSAKVTGWLMADSPYSFNDILPRRRFVVLDTPGHRFGWPNARPNGAEDDSGQHFQRTGDGAVTIPGVPRASQLSLGCCRDPRAQEQHAHALLSDPMVGETLCCAHREANGLERRIRSLSP